MNMSVALKFLFIYSVLIYSKNVVQSRHNDNSGPTEAANRVNVFSQTPEFKNSFTHKQPEVEQSNDSNRSKFRLVIVDINDRKSNDLVDYRYNSANDTHIFTAIQPNVIKRVTDGGKLLWDSGNREFADEILVKYNEGRPILRIHSFEDESPRELVVRSMEAKAKNKENDSFAYKVVENKSAAEQAQLSEDGNYRIVWKPKYSEHYGKALLIPDSSGRLTVKAIFPQPKKLELVPVAPKTPVKEEPEELTKKEAEVTVKETKEATQPKEVTEEKPKMTATKPDEVALVVPKSHLKEILNTKMVGIDLNINSDSSTDEYSFRINYINDRIFSAKPGYGFKSVKTNSTTIWKAGDSSEYAEYVDIYDTGQNTRDMVVFMYNGKVVRFRRPLLSTIWYKREDHKEFAKFLNKDNTPKKQTEYVMGYAKSENKCNAFICAITFGTFQCC
ncbi:hypothetical protein MACJ_002608 [Theileria orientalis]|uniref:Signal peptide-containing protein n=1 Tax=Theileria orientalis TaxID=68886 RepID=A0A976M694_THEOR|nr:hypothetical protein MACJ_002608 [Theileria orientalis]